MKKGFMKAISILLCVAMLSFFAPAVASAVNGKDLDYSFYPDIAALKPEDAQYPTIILPGINHSVSYLADENGDPYINSKGEEVSGGLMLIDNSTIVSNVLGLVPYLIFTLALRDTLPGLKEKIYSTIQSIMGLMQMDENGETVHNLVTIPYNYPISQMDEETLNWFYRMIPMEPFTSVFGEENVYLYTFPLFGNPMDSAAGLHDYIDMVKQQTGKSKVNLISISLGGTILSAFLDSNPDLSEINKIVNIVSLMDGTDLMADFMARRFNLSDQFLYSDFIPMIMKEATGNAALGYLINILLRILPKNTLYDVLTSAFSGLLDTIIINDPQYWAMLPGDEYEALADRYLRDGKHDVLLAKTDRYQQARLALKKNMLAAADAGVGIYNIAGYGLSFTDGEYNFFGIVQSSATVNGDAIIPIASTTLGATSAPAGKVLSDSYLANAKKEYISPDKSVDASTCLFPDRTWFFEKQHHEVGGNDIVIRLATSILGGKIDNIHSSAAFPQFNSMRNTKSMTRSSSGIIFEAQKVLADTENQYSAQQKASVQKAYNDALAMLAETKGDNEKAKAAYDALYASLVEAGVKTPAKSDSPIMNVLELLLKVFNDFVMRTIGGKGYPDVKT